MQGHSTKTDVLFEGGKSGSQVKLLAIHFHIRVSGPKHELFPFAEDAHALVLHKVTAIKHLK